MLAVPVELLGGFLTPEAALPELLTQAAWVAGASVACALTWREGVKRYGAFGA
jgi:ABC-type uncharacterized transport system permease subunit